MATTWPTLIRKARVCHADSVAVPGWQLLREIFGVEPPLADWKPETWPDYAASVVRMDGGGGRDCVLASFGLVPRSRVPQGVRPYDTMNARSETVGEKRGHSAAHGRRSSSA